MPGLVKRRRIHRKRGKKTLATRVRRIEKSLISNRPEIKYYEDFVLNGNTSWSGAIRAINLPTQGTTDQMRIGDVIDMKSFIIKGHLNGGGATDFCRLLVVYAKSLGVASVSDVLATGYLGTGNACDAPFNKDNRTSFKVLWDQTYSLSVAGTGAVSFYKKVKLSPLKTYFNAGTTTVNDGGLYLIYLSNNVAGATPTISYVSRTWYTDA